MPFSNLMSQAVASSGVSSGNSNNSEIPHNTYKTYSSKCKVRIYHYKDPNPPSDDLSDAILETEVIDLDSENKINNPVIGYSFTKSNSACAGYFQLTLAPTENWKQRIKPGDWLAIYLSNGTTDKYSLRCLGNVDTITMSDRMVNSTGARHITFIISGRDFAKVFEKYLVYINFFTVSGGASNEVLQQTLVTDVLGTVSGSPDQIIKILLQTFLGDGGNGAGAFAGQTQLQQWYIPSALSQDFGGSGNKFYNILSLDNGTIQEGLPGRRISTNVDVRSPLWSLMQENANLDINELFVELDDTGDIVKPAIYLRTIPFTFSDYEDPTGSMSAFINKFLDLPALTISGNIIISAETRINEHDRFTFMVYLSDILESQSYSANSSMALLNGKFPYINGSGCKRYGLTVYQRASDFVLQQNSGNQFQPDPNLLLAWNYLLQHWYENNAHMEDATLTIMGQPDTRLGKRVDIIESPLLAGFSNMKFSYYLEAYSENWEYGQPWTQQLMLTRGIFVDNGKEKYSYQVYSDDNKFYGTSNIKRGT